jgi:hypothetical protein
LIDPLQLVGYVGSAIIAASLTMRSIVRLRLWNLVGAALFTVYGVLVQAWPVVLLDGYIVAIDLYYLWDMKRRRDYFELLDIPDRNSAYVKRFLAFYDADLRRFFPSFSLPALERPRITITLRNMVPAGLFVHELAEDGDVVVHLDYVVPAYRDLLNAYHLYDEKAPELAAAGARRIVARSYVPAHDAYLRRLGFHGKDEGPRPWIFTRALTPSGAPPSAS